MRVRSALASLLLIGLLTTPAWAQKAEFQDVLMHNAAVATANGTVIAVDRYNAIAIEVTITGTATVSFEGSVLGTTASAVTCTDASTGFPVQTATASGMFQCNTAGIKAIQARISAYTSGTVTVYARASTAILGGGGGGGGGSAGSSTPTLAGCWANAAAPVYGEASLNKESCDLAANLRMTLGTLISGEDQTNNLMQVSGGVVRTTTFSSVASATTSSVTTVPIGVKTFMAYMGGASETKAFDLTIYGNWQNSTTGGQAVCRLYVPSTASVTHIETRCPEIAENFAYWYYTAGVYTSASAASLIVYAQY